MTFLKKRNSNNSRKSKFKTCSRTSSTSVSFKNKQILNKYENKFDSNNLDNSSKKIFKSLSFHLSEGDDIYE